MKASINFLYFVRKLFPRKIIVEAYAYAIDNEVLGKFVFKKHIGIKNHVLARYIPVEGVDCKKDIITFKFNSEKQESSEEILEILKEKLEEEQNKNPNNAMIYSAVISAISPKNYTIFVPFGVISITNNFISKCISDKWFGLEFLEEIPEFYKKSFE